MAAILSAEEAREIILYGEDDDEISESESESDNDEIFAKSYFISWIILTVVRNLITVSFAIMP